MLRDARERRGETLADVARALKLSTHQVEALEQERFDTLPGPAFVRGFMRNYARHLKLDLEARIADLDFGGAVQPTRLTTVTNASGEIPAGGQVVRSGVKPALVVVTGMVIVLGAGWYFDWFRMDEPPQASAPRSLPAPEPAPPALAIGARLGDAPAVMSEPAISLLSGAEGSDDSQSAAASGDMITGDEPEDVPGADANGTPEQPAVAEPAVAREPAASTVGGAAEEESVELPAGHGRLLFSLSGESWIQVRDRDGVSLFTGTGTPGSTRVVQGQPPFAIVVGNAAMVSLTFNGEEVDLAPHTRSGGVARMTVQ